MNVRGPVHRGSRAASPRMGRPASACERGTCQAAHAGIGPQESAGRRLLGAHVAAAGIRTAARAGLTRVAPYLYNTEEEIETAARVLAPLLDRSGTP